MSELDLAWQDVLRRSRLGRGTRLAPAGVATVAMLSGGSALAVLLTRPPSLQLPKAADRSNVAVVVNPRTGRVVVEAAPWTGHDGICYLIAGVTDGCTTRFPHGAGFNESPPSGYTFDARVASVTATLRDGRTMRLPLHRFGGRLGVAFFVSSRPTDARARLFVLRDAAGRALSRATLPARRP